MKLDANGNPVPDDESEHPTPEETPEDKPAGDPPADPPAPPVDPNTLTIEQLQAEIAKRDAQIVAVGEEKNRLQNEALLDKGERDRLAGELATAITSRTELEQVLGEKVAAAETALAQQQEATLTLNDARQSTSDELRAERAKRVKAELILGEFPDLAAYKEVIQESDDPEVIRKACHAIRAANAAVLETQRQVLATGAPTQTPPAPERTAVALDPATIKAYLQEAMGDPAEYQRRRKLVADRIAAANPQR
jgi:hypothetical protein